MNQSHMIVSASFDLLILIIKYIPGECLLLLQFVRMVRVFFGCKTRLHVLLARSHIRITYLISDPEIRYVAITQPVKHKSDV
jgi:hypothetical protein